MSDSRGGTADGLQPSVRAATKASDALEERQQELMGEQSSEGRPPSRRMGRMQWRWFAVFAAVLVGVAGGWIALADIGGRAVLVGVGLVALLLVAGAPVWVAGLLRGREERSALRDARLEQRPDRTR